MRTRYYHHVLFVYLAVLFAVCFIAPVTAYNESSGHGNISSGNSIQKSIAGYSGGRIEGSYQAHGGPLLLYVLHSDDFSGVDSIHDSDCMVLVKSTSYSFGFDVMKEGDWILVLKNPANFSIEYEVTWKSTGPLEIQIMTIGSMIFPTIIVIIGVSFAIFIRRGSVIGSSTDSRRLLPPVMGLILLILSFLTPFGIQAEFQNTLFSGFLVVSPVWTFTLSNGVTNFGFGNISNPFYWLATLILFGPMLLYPYATILYYQGRTTLERTYRIGIIGLIPLLVGCCTTLVSSFVYLHSNNIIVLPLPAVLMIGVLITRIIPARSMQHTTFDMETR